MAAASGNKAPMTDEERIQLAEKLDKELAEFVEKLPKTPYKDGFRKDNMDKEMEEHPAFRTAPIHEGEDLPPLVAAMQALKYDPEENSPDELANNYKEDGNHNFKLKKYQWAITAYTEGIKLKSNNLDLNAQLYTNRATAHYYLGNMRSSLKDCKIALKMKPNHMKAIIKSAQCCMRLKEYTESIKYCNMGLAINAEDKVLLGLREDAEREQKVALRDERKNAATTRKKQEQETRLLATLKERNIQVAHDEDRPLNICDLESQHPMAMGSKVFLDNEGTLHWPVLYFYPEQAETNFIKDVPENTTIADQLLTLCGRGSQSPEDPAWKNMLNTLSVYFDDHKENNIRKVQHSSSLKDILSDPRYIIDGVPAFKIFNEGSEFQKQYIDSYSK